MQERQENTHGNPMCNEKSHHGSKGENYKTSIENTELREQESRGTTCVRDPWSCACGLCGLVLGRFADLIAH